MIGNWNFFVAKLVMTEIFWLSQVWWLKSFGHQLCMTEMLLITNHATTKTWFLVAIRLNFLVITRLDFSIATCFMTKIFQSPSLWWPKLFSCRKLDNDWNESSFNHPEVYTEQPKSAFDLSWP
jgi:hypothetical protein